MPCTEKTFSNKVVLMTVQNIGCERRLGLDSGLFSVSTQKQLRVVNVIPKPSEPGNIVGLWLGAS